MRRSMNYIGDIEFLKRGLDFDRCLLSVVWRCRLCSFEKHEECATIGVLLSSFVTSSIGLPKFMDLFRKTLDIILLVC